MTRKDLIEHAAYIITEAPELKDCRKALYRFYKEHHSLFYTGSAISFLLIDCLYWYYSYIDIHVTHDDIEYHLWGEDELFQLNEMLYESYRAERKAKSTGD